MLSGVNPTSLGLLKLYDNCVNVQILKSDASRCPCKRKNMEIVIHVHAIHTMTALVANQNRLSSF